MLVTILNVVLSLTCDPGASAVAVYFTFKINSISVYFLNLHGNHHRGVPEAPEQRPDVVLGAVSPLSDRRKRFLAHGSGGPSLCPRSCKGAVFPSDSLLCSPVSSSPPWVPHRPHTPTLGPRTSPGCSSPASPRQSPSTLNASSFTRLLPQSLHLTQSPRHMGHVVTYRRLPSA